MQNVKELSVKEMQLTKGGKYYGNGVSCEKHSCSVNWGQAWNESLNRWGNSIAGGLTGIRQH